MKSKLAAASLVLLATACGGGPPEAEDRYVEQVTLDQCHAGDMAACDQAFYWGQAGSEIERYGLTCGNRRDADEEAEKTPCEIWERNS